MNINDKQTNKPYKRLLISIMIFIGISGCFSVLFGAWLAHGAEHLTLAELSRLNHAWQYQFLHSIALLVVFLAMYQKHNVWFFATICFWITGIILFSGSLYFKTFFMFTLWSSLAPLGGITFAFGWITIAIASRSIFKNFKA